MNLNEFKAGDVVQIDHARKGIVQVRIDSIDETSPWLDVTVVGKKVIGMVNEWEDGEKLPCRKTLIRSIKKITANETA